MTRADVSYRVTRWTVEDGLTENAVHAVAQSADGHLWFGTTGGLVRYNGTTLKRIDDRPQPSVPPMTREDRIQALLPARDGTLWIGTGGNGLAWMKNEVFGVFERHADLPGDVAALAEDAGGRLWIGTTRGLYCWDGRTLEAVRHPAATAPQAVASLLTEPDGSIIVGWRDRPPLRWDGSEFHLLIPERRFPFGAGVHSLVRDANGVLWCGLRPSGVLGLKPDGSVTAESELAGLPSHVVIRAWLRDRSGKLFAGTSDGLFEFRDGRFDRMTSTSSPIVENVRDLFQDAEGSLIVGSEQGALLISGESVRLVRGATGMSPDDTRSVMMDRDGWLWIGSDSSGLSRMRDGRLERMRLRSSNPAVEPGVLAMEQRRDGSLVTGTTDGVYLIAEGKATAAPATWGVGETAIRAIVEDPQGNLWLGGETLGLVIIQADGSRRADAPDARLPTGGVRCLLASKTGGTWVGTDTGLLHVRPEGNQHYGRVPGGLPHESVQALLQTDDGTLWIGTAGGLARLRHGRMRHWTHADGLRDERIFSLIDDRSGGIWINSPSGIYGVRIADLEGGPEGSGMPVGSAILGARYGIIGGTYRGGAQPATARGKSGELYFTSASGLVVLDPRSFAPAVQPPKVVLDRVEFNNSRVKLRNGEFQAGPGSGLLAIKFSALSFRDSQLNQFRYRLEGVDADWVSVNRRRDTLYTNLAPGLYRFQVLASNSDGVWNLEGVTARIRILPRFYQTLWFQTGAGATLAALLALGYWIRFRLLRLRQRELERQVAERTRDLQHEVDQRLRTEEQLRHTSDLLARAFRASPVPLMLCRVDDGTVIEANAGLAELAGSPLEQVLGKPDSGLGLWPSPGERNAVFSEIRSGRTVHNRELRVMRASGERRLLMSAEDFELSTGHHALFVVLDITERSALELQVHRLQKVEAIGTLAAGVAHDFNNLLTIIGGHVSLILDASQLTTEDRDALDQVRIAVTRAAKLTQQLLAYSRRQQLDVKPFLVNPMVLRLAGLLAPVLGETIQVVHQLDPALPAAVGDEHQIEQVVINMAVNARDAMPQGGELRLATSVVDLTNRNPPRDADALPGRYVRLTVEDTGSGMDAETLARVFEPFFTTKGVGRGTGLGLATAFGIIKQHQGWIDVRSEPGHGTTFEVFLPATTVSVTPPPSTTPPRRAAPGGECILVAEDEASVRQFVRSILIRQGYQVLEASSGPDALRVARSHDGRIHVLLTDFVMPEGMNGRELSDILLQERPTLKVIVCTGYSTELVGLGSTRNLTVIRKPFEADELLATLHRVLAA
ncbi:MAG: two-component regulator propeller domain-containing protein [Opitutaceae bacterium]